MFTRSVDRDGSNECLGRCANDLPYLTISMFLFLPILLVRALHFYGAFYLAMVRSHEWQVETAQVDRAITAAQDPGSSPDILRTSQLDLHSPTATR